MEKQRLYQFEDQDLPQIVYKPSKEKKVQRRNVGLNTEYVNYEDAEVNTNHAENDMETQTEDAGIQAGNDDVEVDEEKLGKFMKKSLARILLALVENETSQVSNDFEAFVGKYNGDLKQVYTLCNKSNALVEKEHQLEITDISWNSTGLILAASLGKFEHEGMSNNPSFLYIWNLSKRDFKPDTPNLTIENTGSIMCIEFHPTKPSLIAGGTFNGEVYLWDISQQEENVLFYSKIDDYFHREAVSRILWFEQKLPGTAKSAFNLLSISTDGKALIWDLNNKLKFPTKGYSLVRKKDGNLSFVGALSISQSHDDKTCFILGTEAGSVLRLSLNNINRDFKKARVFLEQRINKEIRWREETEQIIFNIYSKNRQEVKDFVEQHCISRNITDIKSDHIFSSRPDIRKIYSNPISFAYEFHFGPVYSCDCSPFGSLFLTSSLDGTIKIFEQGSNKPLMTFEHSNYIFKVEWSPSRPTVFAAASGNGEVYIYDLIKNKKEPVYTFAGDDEKSNIKSALTFRYNKVQKDLIAVAYSGCSIKICQMGQTLYTPGKEEQSTLNSLSTFDK